MIRKHKTKFIYHLLAILTISVWGVTFVSTKELLLAGMDAAQIFFLRFIIAYLGIWGLCLVCRNVGADKSSVDDRNDDADKSSVADRNGDADKSSDADKGGAKSLLSKSASDEFLFFILGITGGSLYFLTENTALIHTQACNVSFIVCSAPLITLLLSIATSRMSRGRIGQCQEKVAVTGKLVIGTILAIGGLSLLTLGGHELGFFPKGDLLALGAAGCWAVYTIILAPLGRRYDNLFITRKVFFYGLLTILPFVWGRLDISEIVAGNRTVLLNLTFLSLVASLACFVVWNKVVSEIGNISSTNYIYLNPFFTLVAATLVLGEKMTAMEAAGSVAIVLGVFLAGTRGVGQK